MQLLSDVMRYLFVTPISPETYTNFRRSSWHVEDPIRLVLSYSYFSCGVPGTGRSLAHSPSRILFESMSHISPAGYLVWTLLTFFVLPFHFLRHWGFFLTIYPALPCSSMPFSSFTCGISTDFNLWGRYHQYCEISSGLILATNRWNAGSGTFKRVMVVSLVPNAIQILVHPLSPQYTYSLTIPMIFCCSFGFTIIKYKEGYLDFPGLGSEPLHFKP